MLLMRLALIPMNLVNASCALSPTPAGAVGAEASRGSPSPLTIASRIIALAATAALLLIIGRRLGRSLRLAEAAED